MSNSEGPNAERDALHEQLFNRERMEAPQSVKRPESILRLADYPSAIRETKATLAQVREMCSLAYVARKAAEVVLLARLRSEETSDKAAERRFTIEKESDPDFQLVAAREQQAIRRREELEGELEELRGMFAVNLLNRAEEVFAPLGKILDASSILNMATQDDSTPLLPFGQTKL